MSASNTGASLRWRARIAKEAMVVPLDDSETDDAHPPGGGGVRKRNREDDKESILPRLKGILMDNFSVLALNILAVVVVTASIWSLQVTHSILVLVTAALNVSLSLLATWQQRVLRKHGSLQRVHSETQHKERSLRLQNERLFRQFITLDTKFDRIHQIQSELQRRVAPQGQVNIDALIQTLQSFKQVHSDLQKQLQRKVQEQIIQSVLTTDSDRNWELSPVELEQLIHRLQALPGVAQFNEKHLRAILVDNDCHDPKASLANMVRLLRQVVSDSEAASSSSSSSSSSSTKAQRSSLSLLSNGGGSGTVYKKPLLSTVFSFDTRQIRSCAAQQPKLESGLHDF